MAYTSPPVFADTAILSATQLNILSDDLAYLYGILKAPSPAFASHFFNQDLSISNNGWAFRYRHRYFHHRVKMATGAGNNIHMFVNGTDYTLDSTVRASPYVYTGYIDVNAQGLTLGSVYELYFTTDFDSPLNAIVEFIIQAEGTSL